MRNPWSRLLLPLALAAPSFAADKPVLTFEKNAVLVSGLTAGETVAWLGVERFVDEEYSSTLSHRTEATPVAADGQFGPPAQSFPKICDRSTTRR